MIVAVTAIAVLAATVAVVSNDNDGNFRYC